MKDVLKKSDFYYELPEELIAQDPIEERDHSRLLILGRESGAIEHRHFYDIVDKLEPGDLLVLNDSKVFPARLYGVREDTGAQVEFLLTEQKGPDVWETLVKPGKKVKAGCTIVFGEGRLKAHVLEVLPNGDRKVRFEHEGEFFQLLDSLGQMPLPHYITHALQDKDRYQTVYAKDVGSCAAPTAGLHFTQEILQRLKDKGVNITYITLHVGIGTFRPVKEENVLDHVMHSEHYFVTKETADLINATKEKGKRVIAVGTTSCRTLEAVASANDGKVVADSRYTDIFIYPGYQFKVLDGLITNFHLPESTLIMLVSAFAGYENTMHAYKVAVEERYRFFSFGDAMLII